MSISKTWTSKPENQQAVIERYRSPDLPRIKDIGDKKNNGLDNLALVTKSGHKLIHFLQVKDSVSVQLKRSSLAEVLESMT